MVTDNVVIYHLHTDLSLCDSCTDYKLYVDKAVELGQPAIAFSEHGKPLQWVKKKMYCDEKGIKYLHAVEVYMTETLEEKIKDNYHTVLIAKNLDGVRELNKLISMSCDEEHFYGKNRISFKEFLNLSDNIISTSACLASPLNKLPITHPMYEKLVKKYDYLEIQPHDCQAQRDFNVHLMELAEKYHKPLIAATDTHSLTAYKAECRKLLIMAKYGKVYEDNDIYDTPYKSRAELEEAFAKQGVVPKKIYEEAINNTVVMANSVEDFELDTSIKYPILYGTPENDREKFIETVYSLLDEKLEKGIIPREQEEGFRNALQEEIRVFTKVGMCGFMECMSELIRYCRAENIPLGPARGSVGGSRAAYVSDIIDINPETWHTVFSRFCNEARVEVGDIDIDLITRDRPKIFDYIVGRFGKRKTARVASFGTVVEAGTIDLIGQGLFNFWKEEHPEIDSKNNPYAPAKMADIKAEYKKNSEKAKKDHPDIFYYFDGLLGTKVAQSVHPAGMVISPVNLDEYYGVFEKEGYNCLFLDMDETHDVGGVKFDFLGLNNIKIISDACELANIPYPRTSDIDFNDQAVWKDMLRSPVGIFQMESDFAYSMLTKFKPKSIFDMALVTASVRPSGASYRDRLMNKEINKNPSAEIDALLKDNYGYLIYQEDIIKFLQDICGLSGSEADTIRRAIGHKDEEKIREALPRILSGYCSKSDKPAEIATKEAQGFLKVIEDSSSYSFGYNHAIAYCIIGYICAYLRYYYPYAFITSYLNNAQFDKDVLAGTALAADYGITITPPKYGFSKADFYFNKEHKQISKGIASIKDLSAVVGEELYELSQNYNTDSFMELLQAIKNKTCLNKTQKEKLIQIDYFSEFGNIPTLTRINRVFEFFKEGTAKSIKKTNVVGFLTDILPQYATDIGVKGNELKSFTITDMEGLLKACEEYIKSLKLKDLSLSVKVANSLDTLGYVAVQTNKEEDRRKLILLNVIPLRSKGGSIWAYKLITQSLGSGKQSSLTLRSSLYNTIPVSKGDIIYVEDCGKDKKGYWNLYLYRKIV